MRGLLDYCMRRKGRFLIFFIAFVVSGLLGYQGVTLWARHRAEEAQSQQADSIQATAGELGEVEVPKTGTLANQKDPNKELVSDYSSGKTSVAVSAAQTGTFPFDFGRDLKPDITAVEPGAKVGRTAERELIRTVAKGIFGCSTLMLALRFLSDRYLR